MLSMDEYAHWAIELEKFFNDSEKIKKIVHIFLEQRITFDVKIKVKEEVKNFWELIDKLIGSGFPKIIQVDRFHVICNKINIDKIDLLFNIVKSNYLLDKEDGCMMDILYRKIDPCYLALLIDYLYKNGKLEINDETILVLIKVFNERYADISAKIYKDIKIHKTIVSDILTHILDNKYTITKAILDESTPFLTEEIIMLFSYYNVCFDAKHLMNVTKETLGKIGINHEVLMEICLLHVMEDIRGHSEFYGILPHMADFRKMLVEKLSAEYSK